jgi:hypothetical protein
MKALIPPIVPFRSTSRVLPLILRHGTQLGTLVGRHYSYDHVIIGAGVVGLAVANKIAE